MQELFTSVNNAYSITKVMLSRLVVLKSNIQVSVHLKSELEITVLIQQGSQLHYVQFT